MVVKYPIVLGFRGKENKIEAGLTNKIWFNAIAQDTFTELFGETWMSLKKPYEIVIKGHRIVVDKYCILDVSIGSKKFSANFFITNAIKILFDEEYQVIIGKKSLEKNRIRIIEE